MKPHEVVELFRKRLPLATFEYISVNHGHVGFVAIQYGVDQYMVHISDDLAKWTVSLITPNVGCGYTKTPDADRLHQILMGWKRDDAGNMHPPQASSSKD